MMRTTQTPLMIRSLKSHVRAVSFALIVSAPTLTLAQQPLAANPPGGGGPPRETTVPVIESGKWTGKRLRDGQPDVEGHWSNTIANHNNWTDPQGGVPGDPSRRARPNTTREQRAPSRISDPPSGEIPFQPWALAKQQEFLQYFHNPIKPEYIEPLARCAPAGVPKSFTWHGYEIRQYPNYVVFLFNSGTRIIHLDGKPHLPESIKLWNADSRGRWEGNTLVVDVTNNNAKARLARTGEFFSDKVHIEERYVFDNSGKRYNYVAKLTDPTVFTRPWTTTIPARRYTDAAEIDGWNFETALANTVDGKPLIERPERICVENNGGFGNVAVASK
jgi:hypothetical protein